jgi:selenocysteine lyase/cysteine desulfurase
LVLVDLAQTAGHYPFHLGAMDVDLAAFSGHKGLLGPQGIGGLWVRPGIEVHPLLLGGTGGDSLPLEMPDSYPDHLEAGTQNGPAMAGLAAGVEWILEHGVAALHDAEMVLRQRLLDGIRDIPGVRIRSPEASQAVGIVTLTHEEMEPGELARVLERSHGVQGRAGLHCAPDAHESLGTLRTGALRLSLGWATTPRDVDQAVTALREISLASEVR